VNFIGQRGSWPGTLEGSRAPGWVVWNRSDLILRRRAHGDVLFLGAFRFRRFKRLFPGLCKSLLSYA
jgi:hypothetical protein